jgi:hypothetical protein
MIMQLPLQGLHYRSEWFYNTADFFKRAGAYNARFRIAARYIAPRDSVLDVCSGPGRLKDFIPATCSYAVIEASPEFQRGLKKRGIGYTACDLHAGMPADMNSYDVVVMIISLAQFRKTSADLLLESFKKIARRVVIVEEVVSSARSADDWFQKIVDHLCATDYYVPVTWYTPEDFETLMSRHGYRCEQVGHDYRVGCYEVGL